MRLRFDAYANSRIEWLATHGCTKAIDDVHFELSEWPLSWTKNNSVISDNELAVWATHISPQRTCYLMLTFCSISGNRGKSTKSTHRRFGQEKVFGTIRSNRRPILFLNPQTNLSSPRRCSVFLRQQRDSTNISNNGLTLPGKLFRHIQSLFHGFYLSIQLLIVLLPLRFLPSTGTSWRRLLPLHCLLWRKCLRKESDKVRQKSRKENKKEKYLVLRVHDVLKTNLIEQERKNTSHPTTKLFTYLYMPLYVLGFY